jgi:hypothetical protein
MLLRYMRSTFPFYFSVIWALVGVVIFAVTAIVGYQQHRRAQGFYERTAVSTGRHAFSHASGGDTYYLDFQYTDQSGQSHPGSGQISRREYDSVRAGDPARVYVSDRKPDDAWLASSGPPSALLTLITAGLASVFFFPGAYFAWKYFRQIERRTTALARGRYAVGRVESIGAGRYRCIQFSWNGSDGLLHGGTSIPLTKGYASHWRKGDQIAVYVHPADPTFAEPDFFGYRQPM